MVRRRALGKRGFSRASASWWRQSWRKRWRWKLRLVRSRIGAQWRRSIFSIDAGPKFWRQPDDLFGPTLLFDRFASSEIDGVPSTVCPLECGRFESDRARKYHPRE